MQTPAHVVADDEPAWRALVRLLVPPAVLSGISWLGAPVNYLLFHSLAELFSITVALSALMVASTAMRYSRDPLAAFVSVAIGWCAGLDLLHTLAFKGMHILPVDNANPATQLWVAARFLQAGALLAAPFLLQRQMRIAWAHLIFGCSTLAAALLIFQGHFPDAYLEGQGLTSFKIYSEYIIIAMLGLSALLLWQRRQLVSPGVFSGMLAAIVAMMLSEFAFTQYVSVYAESNLIGHLLKIHAYWFVYIALVRNKVHEPFVKLQDEVIERERLGREREELVHQLSERIKELKCMNSVAELTERPDLDVTTLLKGVAELLPAGFMFPDRLFARVDCDWGQHGAELPAQPARHQLREAVCVDGRKVGHISVWYPDATADRWGFFLAEESTLLRNVALQVGEAIARLKAQERIQRLQYLYEMLSATNRSLVHSQSREALLENLAQALLAHGTFPILFVAMANDESWPLHLKQHHGIGNAQLPLLQHLLSDPNSPLRRMVSSAASGQVFSEPLPRIPVDPAYLHASELAKWSQYLQDRGVIQRAVIPLMCQGKLLGLVTLYASGLVVFDEEQLRLLREIAGDMSFALDNLAQREKFLETSQQAQLLEVRFREVFKASPVPMLIMDLGERRIRAINDAHAQWLGYALEDIAAEDDWFRHAYPSDQKREALRSHWEAGIAQARLGQPVTSPELTLRCKDGNVRTAQGTVTVVGNDAIVAWTDLTDIREGERALRESERRFRGMVEQTLSGMYVRRDGKFIYVNPKYAEITGWPAEELIGKDVLTFTAQDEENLRHIRQAWAELHDGKHNSVSYTVPFRRRDGQLIHLGLTARVITWDDDQPATIVLAEDITERKRAEEQIAAYVRQLEGAMRGTLQAVSNMVEMRDPYTAGHERRVGLIASAIAQEMGWSEERCKSLELLGLVHDIGKIAVPSEILTKPTRLSKLEMEMMKGHAQAGYDILKDVPFPTPVAEIIRQHHERMDGSGYPRGLKGDEILPEARVLAVADVIESMASHRPYRPAVGLDAALTEVENNRGRLYAPEVVDAAVRLVRDKGFVLPG